jgi:predicted N-acetyltransferase YhbS
MAIPVTSIGGAGALHEAVRKHPEYGFILALVCLALGLVLASVMFTPQAVGSGMNSGESWFVGP